MDGNTNENINGVDLLPQKKHNVNSPIDTTPILMNGKIVSKDEILKKSPFNINTQSIILPPNFRNLNMNPETTVTNNLPNFYINNVNRYNSDNEDDTFIPTVYDESNPINSPPRTRSPIQNDDILHVKRIDLGSPPSTTSTISSNISNSISNKIYESKAVDDQQINNVYVPKTTMERIRNTIDVTTSKTQNTPRIDMSILKLQEPIKPVPYSSHVKEVIPENKVVNISLPTSNNAPVYTKPLEQIKEIQQNNITVPRPVVPQPILQQSSVPVVPQPVLQQSVLQQPVVFQNYQQPPVQQFPIQQSPVSVISQQTMVPQSYQQVPVQQTNIKVSRSPEPMRVQQNQVIEEDIPIVNGTVIDNLNVLEKVKSPHRNTIIKKKNVTMKRIIPRKNISSTPINNNNTRSVNTRQEHNNYRSNNFNQTSSPVYKIKDDVFSDSDEEIEEKEEYIRKVKSPVRKVILTGARRIKKIQPFNKNNIPESPIQSPVQEYRNVRTPEVRTPPIGNTNIRNTNIRNTNVRSRPATPQNNVVSTPIMIKTPTYMRNYKINTPIHHMSPKYQENPRNVYVNSGFKDTNYHYILSDTNGVKKQYINTTGASSTDPNGLNIPMPDYDNMSPIEQARYHADFDSLFAEIAPDLGFKITETGHDTPLPIRHVLYDRYLTHYYVRAETWKYEIALGVISWCMEKFFDTYLLMPASGFVDVQSLHIRRFKKALYEIAKNNFKGNSSMETDPLQFIIKLTFINFAIHLFFNWIENMAGGLITLNPVRQMITDFLLEDNKPEMGLNADGGLPRPNRDNEIGGLGEMMNVFRQFTTGEMDLQGLIEIGRNFFNNGPIQVDDVDEDPPNE